MKKGGIEVSLTNNAYTSYFLVQVVKKVVGQLSEFPKAYFEQSRSLPIFAL